MKRLTDSEVDSLARRAVVFSKDARDVELDYYLRSAAASTAISYLRKVEKELDRRIHELRILEAKNRGAT
jgi:hypothetical protein